ncbi:Cytochrome P450 72A552-like protein [Drosera capensis]
MIFNSAMKFTIPTTVPLVIVSVAIILATWTWSLVINWIWLRPKKLEGRLRQQGLSGKPYRLLFGDMKESQEMKMEVMSKPMVFDNNDYFSRVDPFLDRTIREHGEKSFVWIGPFPTVTITKPELIREVFSRMHDFQKPILNRFSKLLLPGLVRYEGQKWAKHRKLLNPAFHLEKLKLMLPAFYASCVDLMGKWDELLSRSSPCEVDVWPYFQTFSADVISRAAFGSSYDEGRRTFQLLRQQADLAVQIFTTGFIPGWRYLPTRSNKQMMVLEDEMHGLIRGMIDKRKRAMEAGDPPKDDLLSILMNSSLGEGRRKIRLTAEEVIEECKLFYFAGQETTCVLLVWTLILLAKHQDWQGKARDEVLKLFGNNKPEYDGLNNLKTVTMILNEVLRLYSPVITTTRSVPKDTKLGNLSLPAGIMLNLVMTTVQQDTKLWGEDAKEFRPDRFAEGVAKAVEGNDAFFPFGWGQRICIGQNFAMMEAKLVISMILQRFSFEFSPSYTHGPMAAVMLQPQYGARLLLRSLHDTKHSI